MQKPSTARKHEQQKELKELQKVWYAKLKEHGFKDLEDSEGRLKVYSATPSGPQGVRSAAEAEMRKNYYREASMAVYDHRFSHKLDKTVWALHAEGHTISFIQDNLGLSRGKVQRMINRLKRDIYTQG